MRRQVTGKGTQFWIKLAAVQNERG